MERDHATTNMESISKLKRDPDWEPGLHDSRPQELLQFVSFRVGEEEFGLEILRVQEIIRIQQLTRVPSSPLFVEGVINLRGKVIPVVALRKRFGMTDQPSDKQTRIIVVEVKGMVLGFIVDSVSQILRIPAASVESPPRLGKVEREYVAGVGKFQGGLLILIDVERLMADFGGAASLQAGA